MKKLINFSFVKNKYSPKNKINYHKQKLLKIINKKKILN